MTWHRLHALSGLGLLDGLLVCALPVDTSAMHMTVVF
jgi:hypothetical protein